MLYLNIYELYLNMLDQDVRFGFFAFIFQVYIAAIRNRNLPLPANPVELYEIEQDKEAAAMEIEYLPHRDIFRFSPTSIQH